MSSNKFHYSKRKTSDYARISKKIPSYKRILIVCEGEKSEPNYFKKFPKKGDLVKVEIRGEGVGTKKLINYISSLVKQAAQRSEPYDEVWCVFDKDDFTEDSFNEAISLCKDKNYIATYSNEAFEIWYLLHFDEHCAPYDRKQYQKMLSKRLKQEYQKNSKDMYDILLDKQPTAIRNAKKLHESYANHKPATDNPCTLVYKLVEALNKNFK